MENKKTINYIVISFVIVILAVITGIYYFNFSTTATKHLFAMDTAATVTAKRNNIDAYIEEIQILDKMLSAYDPQSEISKLNKNKSCKLSSDTADFLSRAICLTAKYPEVDVTAGALVNLWNVNDGNPKLPEEHEINTAKSTVSIENICLNDRFAALKNNAQIDPGSCAKGYALDVLFRLFEENKENCGIVSFGSSSLVYGQKPDGKDFVTEIVNPENTTCSVLSFKTKQAFISTSGGYERYFIADGKKYSHIIDLSTGYPVETDLISVTVISRNSGILSDFMSTCIYIGGTEKLDTYLNNQEFEIIAIDKNKNIYCSDSITTKVEIIDNSFILK